MKSGNEPKAQILGDGAELRQRLAFLEGAETSPRRAEKTLRESKKRFRNLGEPIKDWIWEWTPRGYTPTSAPWN